MGIAHPGAGIEGVSLESDPWVDFHSLSSSPKVGSASKTTPIWSSALCLCSWSLFSHLTGTPCCCVPRDNRPMFPVAFLNP